MAERKRMTADEVVSYLLEEDGADFMRESLKWVVQELMEAEVLELIGADHGERTPHRATHRHGYPGRRWDTRAGESSSRPRSCAEAATSPLFWNRESVPSGRWWRCAVGRLAVGPVSVRRKADGPAACVHKRPANATPFLERLMGFEPTTFCMASSMHCASFARISLQTDASSLARAHEGFRVFPGRSRGFG
jgi:hypothetical protein